MELNSPSFREGGVNSPDKVVNDRTSKGKELQSKTSQNLASVSGKLPDRTRAAGKSDPRGLSFGSGGLFQVIKPGDSVRPKAALYQSGPLHQRGAKQGSFRGNATSPAALSSSLSSTRLRPHGSVPLEHKMQLGDVWLGYGSSSFQGMRDYQEDTVAMLPSEAGLSIAVYDGHGGAAVSQELERVLLQNIQHRINDLSMGRSDQAGGDPSPVAIQGAIAGAYTHTNADIGARLQGAMESGSCAVTAIVMKAAGGLHLFCANAGDCRAVLYTGPPGSKHALRLSEDHKPQMHVCPAEVARIADAGGCVLFGRVQGCLAVSRAFGDKTLQPYVIADPFVSVRALNPEHDSFFYLASDGVTDLIDDRAGCAIVADQFARGHNTAQAAHALVSAAYQQGSTDNMSAIVVHIARRL